MQIVVTGAGGFVGKQIIPLLRKQGLSLLLVGRDTQLLRRIFPKDEVCGYDNIPTAAAGYDALLHLAALNNCRDDATWEDFKRVNVDFAVETCSRAQEAGIKQFIYVSSTHALDLKNTSYYARSKREVACELEKIPGIEISIVHLPTVVGGELAGKLAPLNRLPLPLRKFAVSVLSAVRPTVHAEHVAQTITRVVPDKAFVSILSSDQDKNWTFRTTKRAIDLTAAIGVLLLLWWAMAIIWVAIRLQSAGPGIFAQARVGRDEKVFTCYKFRTMDVAAPTAGTHQVSQAYVTSIGKFLRRTKLDELPQVFNVLLNQMSLVGPRPCLPTQEKLIIARRAAGVFSAKPGITGLAQVNRIDMSRPNLLASWDKRYIELRSLVLDIQILLRTAIGSGSGDNTDGSTSRHN